MRRIEFIGASGVGKSTLLREMEKIRDHNAVWISRKEMYRKIQKSTPPLNPFSIRRLLIYVSAFFNLSGINKVRVFSKLLSNDQMKAYKIGLKKYSGYLGMIIEGVANKATYSPIKKMHRLEYFFSLVQELALFESFDPQEIIVFCESVIHNTPGTTDFDKYRNMLGKYQDGHVGITPSAVIHCFLDAPENIGRRIKRGAAKDKFLHKQPKGNASLNEQIARAIIAAQKKTTVMKACNIPVLEINMAESIEDNAAKACAFIRSIRKQ